MYSMLFYHTYSITYTNCLLWQSQIKCIKLLVLVGFIWQALSIAKLSVLYAAFMCTKTNNSVHSCVLSYLGRIYWISVVPPTSSKYTHIVSPFVVSILWMTNSDPFGSNFSLLGYLYGSVILIDLLLIESLYFSDYHGRIPNYSYRGGYRDKDPFLIWLQWGRTS